MTLRRARVQESQPWLFCASEQQHVIHTLELRVHIDPTVFELQPRAGTRRLSG
jgi:hypothetical protein